MTCCAARFSAGNAGGVTESIDMLLWLTWASGLVNGDVRIRGESDDQVVI